MKESKNEDLDKCPICERIYDIKRSYPLTELDIKGIRLINLKGDLCMATEKYSFFRFYVYFHYVPDNPIESGS